MKKLKKLYYSNTLFRSIIEPIAETRRAYINWRNRAGEIVCHRLSEISKNDLEIIVAEFGGSFRIGTKSHLLHRVLKYGSYEPELTSWARKNLDPNKDAVDVGANIGFFSVMMAKTLKNKRVLAVEPTKSALERLKYNLSINCVSENVVIFNGLAGDSNSDAAINIIDGLEEYSSTGKINHFAINEGSEKLENVPQKSIDYLVEEHNLDVGFMKIDVEGAEYRVLKGASNVLKTHRPKIICELNDPLLVENGSSSNDILALLKEFNYSIQDAVFPELQPGIRKYGDIIAYPK